jgi:branched-chain amino acid transport system ATP-binding protein
MSAAHVLDIANLSAWYGESHILHGVNLRVREGEVVSLLGRNGVGRTTTLRAIMGLIGRRSGSIRINGQDIMALPPYKIARLGVSYCPEERGIYAALSVAENLRLPPLIAPAFAMAEADIFQLFPNLAERMDSPGTLLSGGEQQMLAMARVLRTGARLLLLDEISEGLAPVIVQAIARSVQHLKLRGYTLVLVEQNLQFSAALADHFYVMEHGRIVHDFAAQHLVENQAQLQRYLGV